MPRKTNTQDHLMNPSTIRFFGCAGGLAIILGSLAAGFAYCGKLGQRYSPLNHFISELGEIGVSRLAWAFNGGLILGGLLFIPESIGLGLLIPGVWSKLGMLAGCITALAVSLVGVFPMNNISPHIKAAMTNFRFGLVMVVCFSIAIGFPTQTAVLPPLPRLFGLAGIPSILAYTYFLAYSKAMFASSTDALSPLSKERPRVWRLAASEWAIFVTTIPWFIAVAVSLFP
jgi:hypothetical membrane protein